MEREGREKEGEREVLFWEFNENMREEERKKEKGMDGQIQKE